LLKQKRIRKNKSKRKKSAAADRNGAARRWVLSVAGIFCINLLFILGHDIMTQGRMFAAREIVVLGNHQLSEDRVLELADIQPGENIFAVNLGVARKRLLADGWVAEARVGREIPDRLVIRVREHEPMLLLDMGDKFIMSREATIIKPYEETDSFDLPMVTGLSYSDLPLGGSGSDAFAVLMQVLGAARSEEGALSLSRLRQINVDPELGVTLYADGEVKRVRMGFEKYDEKMRRVDRLLAALDRGESDPPLEITELEYDNRIVAGPF